MADRDWADEEATRVFTETQRDEYQGVRQRIASALRAAAERGRAEEREARDPDALALWVEGKVREEREACAQECNSEAARCLGSKWTRAVIAERCAALIRARGAT